VQPLTRRNAEGAPYERLPEIQREIEIALGLEPEAMLANANQLSDETLVYLIRDRRGAQDWSRAEKLSRLLVERSSRVILSTLGALPQDLREDAVSTVLEQLFEGIVALDDDRGDFYQVRFGLALGRLATTAFKQCVLTIAHRRKQQHVDHDVDAEWADSQKSPFNPRRWPGDAVEFADALNGLEAIKDERHRKAFAFHATHEMPIQSDDPTTMTISRYFGVAPRTIANWLALAEADLKRWRSKMS
jgi:hypothetical protein